MELSEYQECKAYFEWAQYYPVLREYLFKIVNEGKRSKINGNMLKLIGLRAGLPDYQLPIPNKNWNGLWIEMKKRSHAGKTKKDNQNEWISKLIKVKQYATYAYGWEDAAKITMDYLNNKI